MGFQILGDFFQSTCKNLTDCISLLNKKPRFRLIFVKTFNCFELLFFCGGCNFSHLDYVIQRIILQYWTSTQLDTDFESRSPVFSEELHQKVASHWLH